MFLQGNGQKVLDERVAYTDIYSRFIKERNAVQPVISNLKEN
jgi:hypothetical protein